MRAFAFAPLLVLAACSGGEGGEQKKVEEAPVAIEAGQWETAFEVASIRSVDKTTPALKAEVGNKETGKSCIAEADRAEPPPELFAGAGYDCDYKTSYIKNGRINASLSCKRSGVSGEFLMSVSGSYTKDAFEGTVGTTTYLPGDGDFEMTRKISGRRTGPTCTPDAGASSKAPSAG
jgi:hypothetical protein